MFDPKRRFATVLQELQAGLSNGSIILDSDSKLDSDGETHSPKVSIGAPQPDNSRLASEPSEEVLRKAISATPPRTPDSENRSSTNLGTAVKVAGQMFARTDIYLDCDFEGTIESSENTVTIGPHGHVKAGIRAREVIVIGHLDGSIEATDRVKILNGAIYTGDISTSRVSIEDGAIFKGSVDILRQSASARSTRHHPSGDMDSSVPAPKFEPAYWR